MTLERKEIRQGQKGFTLVELAVVMIIVGLLIGGILKGQELIANAQVASTVTQVKGIESAVSTFRDSYRSMPGDMLLATTRLPACAAPCANGNGDGRLGNLPGDAAAAGAEGYLMFNHLLRANLLSGYEGTNDVVFGQGLPSGAAGGGFYAGYHAAGALGQATAANSRAGTYLSLRGAAGAPVNTAGAIKASQASRIDAKIDDAAPATGTVLSDNATNCTIAGPPVAYDTAGDPSGCNLYLRIQN